MLAVSARRALVHAIRRQRSNDAGEAPPAFWGRIGPYEAVSRRGVLFLLAPEPAHPALRVKNNA